MSAIDLLKKELELTKAELVHANETIELLAKGEEALSTENENVELLKTKKLLKSAQDELDRVNAHCKNLNLERSKFQSEASILKNENKVLIDENVSFNKENKRLRDDKVSLKEENDVLNSENVVLHSTNVELQSRVTELSVSVGLSDVVDTNGYLADEKDEMFKNLNFLVTQLRKHSE